MSHTYGCSFVFYGDDKSSALEDRIIAGLEAEGLDFDPMTVTVERTQTGDDDEPLTDTPPRVEKVWVERKMLMSLLEPLRLARVYVLMGSEFEEDIGDDFKPWKWYGSEMLFADSCTAAYRLVMDALTADPPPYAGRDRS